MTPEQQAALVEFAKFVIEQGVFDASDVDGCDIFEKAKKLGLLVETKYDPAVHGECEWDTPPGDQWWVFAPHISS